MCSATHLDRFHEHIVVPQLVGLVELIDRRLTEVQGQASGHKHRANPQHDPVRKCSANVRGCTWACGVRCAVSSDKSMGWGSCATSNVRAMYFVRHDVGDSRVCGSVGRGVGGSGHGRASRDLQCVVSLPGGLLRHEVEELLMVQLS